MAVRWPQVFVVEVDVKRPNPQSPTAAAGMV